MSTNTIPFAGTSGTIIHAIFGTIALFTALLIYMNLGNPDPRSLALFALIALYIIGKMR